MKAKFLWLSLIALSLGARVAAEDGWFAFEPGPDSFAENSATDLRYLNETLAGENGFFQAKEGRFVRQNDQEPVRFWAVNGPPDGLTGENLRHCARLLAKYGVNMVRVHSGLFDRDGNVAERKVRHAIEIVEAMKKEGIYTHFSIYFPLWLTPKPDTPWLTGYDGKQHPFAALFFNPDFQEKYRSWWTALLTTRSEATGKTLMEEPAVAGLEIQNEDSFFFWTFTEENLPEPQLVLLEKQFGEWLARKYGSIQAAIGKWDGIKVKRDAPEEGRVGFRRLWNVFNERTLRDRDTVAFLFEVQSKFYKETCAFLRQMGFKGVITASNWSTASPEIFGPLEKLSYTVGDFIDRHGYFGCNHKGQNAEWSIREGHTYSDRSALRFEAEDPAKPRQFVHPVMDPQYNDLPSMISETTWTRPNRYRSEAPLYLAAYGVSQGTDAIVHFAFDGAEWSVKPRFWMQPWTLMAPAMLGQFPATALIYRLGLVKEGAVVAEVNLNTNDLFALKGTPLPQEAALDELRLKDVPTGTDLRPGERLDPLLHYAGRTRVRFTGERGNVRRADTRQLIDHIAKVVKSSTSELRLDYGKGMLTVNAPAAQGVSGSLRSGGIVETSDLVVQSELELGHIVAVALDRSPLASSRRILLQVMSEEKAAGFQSEPALSSTKRILNIGTNPWMVRNLAGTVRFKRSDAGSLRVTRLDAYGYGIADHGHAREIQLHPSTMYYLVTADPVAPATR